MNFRERLFGQKDILSIGFANLFGSGITAIFWFYIASLLGPAEYGQIHYFLAIAGMAQLVSLFATTNAITVYVAKNIKIHSTLFFISVILGIVSSLVVFLFFYRVDASLLVLGYIIFELSNGFLLGKKLFSNSNTLPVPVPEAHNLLSKTFSTDFISSIPTFGSNNLIIF